LTYEPQPSIIINMKEIAIEDWCNQTIQKVRLFLEAWKRCHGADPQNYPIKQAEDKFQWAFNKFMAEGDQLTDENR